MAMQVEPVFQRIVYRFVYIFEAIGDRRERLPPRCLLMHWSDAPTFSVLKLAAIADLFRNEARTDQI
jgi:hypothetical protein